MKKQPAPLMKRIHRIVNVHGHGVPVDEDGYYLDWKKIKGDYAGVLTSPYGPRYFVLGGGGVDVTLDFARLPGDEYFITAECRPEQLGLHPEDRAFVRTRHEVVESAYLLTAHVLEVLDALGVSYEDPWRFLRKVAIDVDGLDQAPSA